MGLTYASIPTQLGTVLIVSDSLKKFYEHAALASNAAHYARVLSKTNGFGLSDTEEKNAYTTLAGYLQNTLAAKIASEWQAWRSQVESDAGFFGLLKADLSASDEKDAGGAIDYDYEDIDGAIAIIARNGIWGALRREMLADSYYVTPNVIGVGSLTAKSGNRGTLTKTSMAGVSHTLAGTLIITVADEDVTAPKLKLAIELPLPLPDGTLIVEADNYLTCEKSHEDGPTGLTTVLTRSGLAAPTESGDGGAIFSSTSFSTPKTGDMNGGVIYVRVVRQASNVWLIEWYNNSDRTTKVGSDSTISGTSGTSAIDKTLKNGTRFQSTFDIAAAHAALPNVNDEDNDITFDIKTPRLGDRWTVALTNDGAGKFATKLSHMRRVSLPESGSNLFTDSLADAITV
jgi:hypothetical protein